MNWAQLCEDKNLQDLPYKIELNMEKRRLCQGQGPKEFWFCDELGKLSFFDQSGETLRSNLCPEFPGQIKE